MYIKTQQAPNCSPTTEPRKDRRRENGTGIFPVSRQWTLVTYWLPKVLNQASNVIYRLNWTSCVVLVQKTAKSLGMEVWRSGAVHIWSEEKQKLHHLPQKLCPESGNVLSHPGLSQQLIPDAKQPAEMSDGPCLDYWWTWTMTYDTIFQAHNCLEGHSPN